MMNNCFKYESDGDFNHNHYFTITTTLRYTISISVSDKNKRVFLNSKMRECIFESSKYVILEQYFSETICSMILNLKERYCYCAYNMAQVLKNRVSV